MVEYSVKKSQRAKHLTIRVYPNNVVLVTIPKRFPVYLAEHFIKQKEAWINDRIAKNVRRQETLPKKSREDYLENKAKALQLIKTRIDYFNKLYNFTVNKISVKNQTTRWGSCSKNGNLNFNYQIIYLKYEQIDYVVIHELCHLKELNHSKAFWDLVAQALPNYKEVRAGLT